MPSHRNPLIQFAGGCIVVVVLFLILLPFRLFGPQSKNKPPPRPTSNIPFQRGRGFPVALYERRTSGFEYERLTEAGRTAIGAELQRLDYNCATVNHAVITQQKRNGAYLEVDCDQNRHAYKMILKPDSTWKITVLR